MSAASREGRGGGIGVSRAFAACSNIVFIVVHGSTRVAGAAGLSGRDFLTADLRGDLLGAWGTASCVFDPVGILLPTPNRGDGNGNEDSGRALAGFGPEEGGGEVSVGISAKEEESRQKQVKKNKKKTTER